MRRLAALAVAAAVAGPIAAGAAPTLPNDVRVVPVYSTPRKMRITWTENGTAKTYNIHRQVDPNPTVTLLRTVPGGPNLHKVDVLDAAVVNGGGYTYIVEACDATGCVADTPRFNSTAIVWPVEGGREILHGFNEPIGWAGAGDILTVPPPPAAPTWNFIGFHNGVDINKTTANPADGNVVVAPRGGVVQNPAQPSLDNGAIAVRVDIGDGNFEVDSFNHLATGDKFTTLTNGAVIEPGRRLGVIGTKHFNGGNFADHTHYTFNSTLVPGRVTARHPLTLFEAPGDRDPLGNAPALFDENKDGKTVLYRVNPGGPFINHDVATTPLSGNVDVEAEVTDQQGTDPRQAPIDLGYWIEGPLPDSEQHDDVKSAAKPYRLYDFRQDYYGTVPGSDCTLISDIANVANAGCATNGCSLRIPGGGCSSVLKEGTINFPYPVLHHFIVTHAGDEFGTRASISRLEFWRTNAKDDGTPSTGLEPNFAHGAATTKASEARFPDGIYRIHVVASDLVHKDVDLPLPPTRLENFPPFVKEVFVAVDADRNAGSGQPDLPGCELLVYHYKHTHRQKYPRPQDVVLSKAASTLAATGQKVCTKLRFSETVTNVAVDLAKNRGTGGAIAGSAFTGSPSKTYHDDDTWRGSVVLPADASGGSDSAVGTDEHDVALRVTALDRRNAGGTTRQLDADDDGAPDAAGDSNHVVLKLDLSPPTALLDVIKP